MFFTARGKVHFLIRAFFALPVVLAAVVLFIAALAMDSALLTLLYLEPAVLVPADPAGSLPSFCL